MRRLYALMGLLAVAAVGCSKDSGPVSNAATDYTKSLQSDVEKAQAAAEKANQAIAAGKETMNQAQEQAK